MKEKESERKKEQRKIRRRGEKNAWLWGGEGGEGEEGRRRGVRESGRGGEEGDMLERKGWDPGWALGGEGAG